jgi:peptidoglycan/LPS O-acetylase OafA/YrhL
MNTASPPVIAPQHYFRSIDGLRLFAAANVVLFHLEQSGGLYRLQGSPGWLFVLIKGPAFHATLFFILAGFIYTIKYSAHAQQFNVPRFLLSRLRALYPLHVVATLAMVPFVLLAAPQQIPWGKLAFSVGMHLSLLWSLFPLHSFSLNTPSWALSAFFFCYLLFGPTLKLIMRIERRSRLVGALGLCLLPALGWSFLYPQMSGTEGAESFFHVFAPLRFFEFVTGMLLARLFAINAQRCGKPSGSLSPLQNDLIIGGVLVLIVANLLLRRVLGEGFVWASYHVVMLPLYATLLYRFARGSGIFAAFTGLPLVRLLGQSSFYPYLLHIPLSSWIGWVLAHQFGYKRFLHEPLNITLFIVGLYGLSALYWHRRGRARRRARTMAGAVQSA